ncbi:hypothetical protein F2P79_010515 [Pimephales promelas]|nr:hypothetical protein F2P79_010515 [Pimephales promelas]
MGNEQQSRNGVPVLQSNGKSVDSRPDPDLPFLLTDSSIQTQCRTGKSPDSPKEKTHVAHLWGGRLCGAMDSALDF